MNKKWHIKNCPLSIVAEAFKKLYPNIEYEAFFETQIRDEEDGTKVYGLTDFGDDGSIFIFIDADLSIKNATEIFAHELAHAAVGIGHGHDEEWEKAFDDIFEEYNTIGDMLFNTQERREE